MSEALIRRAFKLMTREEQVKLMIWVGETELIRARNDQSISEKLVKRTEEEHQLAVNSVLMEIIEERELKKNPMVQHYESQTDLTGTRAPSYKTQAGVITMFKKAMVMGHPRDAINYYLNKRGRKNKYGMFLGFIIAEIPTYFRAVVQPITVYTEKDPGIEHRKAIGKWRRKHSIKVADYRHHMEHNTLTHFIEGTVTTPQERSAMNDERIARRMKRDGYEPIDEKYKKAMKRLKENESM